MSTLKYICIPFCGIYMYMYMQVCLCLCLSVSFSHLHAYKYNPPFKFGLVSSFLFQYSVIVTH